MTRGSLARAAQGRAPARARIRWHSFRGAGIPSEVLAARIHDRVAEAIGNEPSSPSTERQQAFALSLGKDVAHETQRVASAWIAMAFLDRNRQCLAELLFGSSHLVMSARS